MTILNYRLMIEGCPVEWVTSIAQELTTSDGRIRYAGLQYQGLKIKEALDIKNSFTTSAAINVSIKHPAAAAQFAIYPRKLGQYTTRINAGTLADPIAFNVNSASQLAEGDKIHIGTECLAIETLAANVVDAYQCMWDTLPQTHYIYDDRWTRYETSSPFIYDRPATLMGRRAYLFIYTDTQTSDGYELFDSTAEDYPATQKTADSVIFRGIIADVPKLDADGLTWRFTINHISDLLNQNIGSGDEYNIRGIYRPYDYGCGIVCGASTEDTSGNSPWSGSWAYAHVDGHFNSTQEFIDAINAKIATDIIAAQVGGKEALSYMRVVEYSDGYYLKILTVSSLPGSYPGFRVKFVDNGLGSKDCDWKSKAWRGSWNQPSDYWRYSAPDATDGFVGNTEYYLKLDEGPIYFPNGYDRTGTLLPSYVDSPQVWINHLPNGDSGGSPYGVKYVQENPVTTSVKNKIYTDQELLAKLAVGDKIVASNGSVDALLTISSVNVGSGFFIHDTYVQEVGESYGVFLDGASTLRYVPSASGDVIDFIEKLETNAYKANAGNDPFITTADVEDLTGLIISDEVFLTTRVWNVTEATNIKNILMEDLKLAGWYLCYTSDSKIYIKNFAFWNVETGTAISITDANICLQGGHRIEWSRNTSGIITTVKITDMFRGEDREITIRGESLSVFKNRSRGEYSIAPKSEYGGSARFDARSNADFFAGIGKGILGLLGTDYETLKIPILANTTLFYCQVGSKVSLTSSNVMNTRTGTYGVTAIPAWIIGREIDLDPKTGAVGYLTLLIKSQGDGEYARRGYAPSFRVTNAVLYSGTTWALVGAGGAGATYYGQAGISDKSYFPGRSGMPVAVMKWDDSSPTIATGTIATFIDGDALYVTFDTAAPWGGSYTPGDIYIVELYENFTPYPQIKQWIWIADDTQRLFSDTENAFEIT